jgi:hypothetical protein
MIVVLSDDDNDWSRNEQKKKQYMGNITNINPLRCTNQKIRKANTMQKRNQVSWRRY